MKKTVNEVANLPVPLTVVSKIAIESPSKRKDLIKSLLKKKISCGNYLKIVNSTEFEKVLNYRISGIDKHVFQKFKDFVEVKGDEKFQQKSERGKNSISILNKRRREQNEKYQKEIETKRRNFGVTEVKFKIGEEVLVHSATGIKLCCATVLSFDAVHGSRTYPMLEGNVRLITDVERIIEKDYKLSEDENLEEIRSIVGGVKCPSSWGIENSTATGERDPITVGDLGYCAQFQWPENLLTIKEIT